MIAAESYVTDAHNLGSETKKATGIPMYMAIGQCGSILGTHIFPSGDGPRYIKGFAVSCSLMFTASIAALVLTVSCSPFQLTGSCYSRLTDILPMGQRAT